MKYDVPYGIHPEAFFDGPMRPAVLRPGRVTNYAPDYSRSRAKKEWANVKYHIERARFCAARGRMAPAPAEKKHWREIAKSHRMWARERLREWQVWRENEKRSAEQVTE